MLAFNSKSVLLFAGLSMLFFYLGVALWTAFYANPLIDKTALNFDWFLQASAVTLGLFAAAFALKNN